MDTARHRKRRWAYSRFSSSMLSNVCPYVSSKVFGKTFNTIEKICNILKEVKDSVIARIDITSSLAYHTLQGSG